MSALISLKGRITKTRQCVKHAIEIGLVSKKRKEIKAASVSAVSDIDATLLAIPKFKHPKIKKSLKVLSNTLQGVIHGIENDELMLSDIRPIVKTIRSKFFPAVESAVFEAEASFEVDLEQSADSDDTTTTTNGNSERADGKLSQPQRKAVKNMLANASSLQEAMLVVKDVLKERQRREEEIHKASRNDDTLDDSAKDAHLNSGLSEQDKHLVARLQELQEHYKALPSTTTGQYAVVRAPVIPIFSSSKKDFSYPTAGRAEIPHREPKNFSMEYKLKQLGIPHIMLDGYVILTNQLLLAVKQDALHGLDKQIDEQHAKDYEEAMEAKKRQRLLLNRKVKTLTARAVPLEAKRRLSPEDKAELEKIHSEIRRIEAKLDSLKSTKIVNKATRQQRDKQTDRVKTGIKSLQDKSGISDKELEALERKRGQLSKLSTESNLPSHIDSDEFANLLLEVINERSHNDYVLVTKHSTPNPRNKKMMFFWIMPSRILKALQQSGWSNIKNWGFPFGAINN